MFKKTGKDRSTKDNLELAGIFSLIAGYTNALAFLTVGFFVSHMTGTSTMFGVNLGKLDYRLLQYLLILLMFIMGSILSSFLAVSYSNSLSFIVEGCILSVVGLVSIPPSVSSFSISPMPLFLSFSMGIQSSATTYLSSAIVRTTHLTGAATDIGLAIVRKDFKAFILLSTIILGFIAGAILGYFGNIYFGIHGFIIPGIVMLVIGIIYLSPRRR